MTAASACSAACDFPLTHRGLATSVRFITGHCREDIDPDYDWASLANSDTTLVIYMGLANIGYFSGHLIASGMPPETPVAAISNGTTARQKQIVSSLDRIADAVHTAELPAPVLFVVGKTVAMQSVLSQLSVDEDTGEDISNDIHCEAERA